MKRPVVNRLALMRKGWCTGCAYRRAEYPRLYVETVVYDHLAYEDMICHYCFAQIAANWVGGVARHNGELIFWE